MIRLTSLSKRYPGREGWAVREVDLEVARGELLVILGESGCGKTTTLKMVNRLVEPTEGRVELDGRDVTIGDPVLLRRGIGYVFQGIGLFPHLTVGENVSVVPELLGWERARVAARVEALLELVGLSPREHRDLPVHALSGGQRQRVGVARALAGEPAVMLMDEPFGALDPVTRDALQGEYRRLHDELGLTTMLVTHDVGEAVRIADRIAVMLEGRIVAQAPPAAFLQDDHPYVTRLLEGPRRQAEALRRLSPGRPS